MTRNKLILIAISLAALLPVLALAGDGPRDRGMGPGFGPDPGSRGYGGFGGGGRHFLPPPGYLDLTAEQIEAVEAIRDRVRSETEALREQHRALRDELEEALNSDHPEPAAVGQLVIDLHTQRPQFRAILESADAEFSALLTGEQLQKWENFKELRQSRGHRERFRHREHRGFGPGPDGVGPGGPGPDDPGFDS